MRITLSLLLLFVGACSNTNTISDNHKDALYDTTVDPLSPSSQDDILEVLSKADQSNDTGNDFDLRLTNEDFSVQYKDFIINEDTTVDELIQALGYGNDDEYDHNNQGYISTINDMLVFGLYYPDYENTELRVVYHERISDFSSYIAYLDLRFETRRGLKIGDEVDRSIELYGKPDDILEENGISKLFYLHGDRNMQIWVREDKVFCMLINYRSDLSDDDV